MNRRLLTPNREHSPLLTSLPFNGNGGVEGKYMLEDDAHTSSLFKLRPTNNVSQRKWDITRVFIFMATIWLLLLFISHLTLVQNILHPTLPSHSSQDESTTTTIMKRKGTHPRSTIPLGRRKPYSSHHCIEPKDMHPMYRSCHFTDVCFARHGGKFPVEDTFPGTLLYLTKDQEEEKESVHPDDLKTCIQRQKFVTGPNIYYPLEESFLTPMIVSDSTLESMGIKKVWSPVPLAIPYHEMNGKNFGHGLGDNVFSFYRIMKLFNLYTDDLDFVPLLLLTNQIRGYFGYYGNYYTGLFTTLQPFVYNQGHSYLSDKEDVLSYGNFLNFYDRFTQGDGQNSILCFENVLSGLYFLSDHGEDPNFHHAKDRFGPNNFHVGRGDDIMEFRQAYMHRLGLDDNMDLYYHTCHHLLHSPSHLAPNSVLIIPRSAGSRGFWWNHEKLISEIKLIENSVREMDFKLSMKEQVQLVAQAKVIISMVGGASYISWFLPPGATLMLLARVEADGELQMNDAHIYDNIPYFHTIYVGHTQLVEETAEHDYDWGYIRDEVYRAIKRYDDNRIAYDCAV